MTYERTLEYLFSMLPMYQKEGKSAYKKDLGNTIALLNSLNNPQKDFKSVHIAGTNGKGTSAHAIAAILQSAGYKTGLYTSPHLQNFTERIKLNGQEVDRNFVIQFVDKIKPAIENIRPSFFEVTVAMAFYYFSKSKVDIAIIETGLGGRLDSTNVINPEVSLITNIGLDHTDMLGDTIAKIAFEKAGIIKPNTPVVIGENHPESLPVFEEKATEMNAPLTLAPKSNFKIENKYTPDYLNRNLDGILGVIEELNIGSWSISDHHVFEGLSHLNNLTGLKGRFQVLNESPLVIADVSHNAEGLKMLFNQINSICKDRKGHLHLIFGTVKDKDLNPIFKLFPVRSTIYWTQSLVPRSLNVSELSEAGRSSELIGDQYHNVNNAINRAKEQASVNDIILITGSTFVVSEIQDL
ncbi:MAG: folylpolyglutamate synthase/dihydrofolate synthase family protein [Ekhidna sp.]